MALTTTEEALVRQLIAQNSELLSLAENQATIISKLGATKKNLGQISTVSSLSNSDILFVRQGSFDKTSPISLLRSFVKPDQATETTTGVVELATAAEVQAGTDTSRAVTPAGMAANTATESRAGVVELATNAEAQSFAANKAIDGAKLYSAFQGANQSIGTSGYQKLPGGMIIQWGQQSESSTGTFPIPFPNACLAITTTYNSDTALSDGAVTSAYVVSASQFRVRVGVDNGNVLYWIAIGY